METTSAPDHNHSVGRGGQQLNSTAPFSLQVNSILLGLLLGTVSLLTVFMNVLVLYAVKRERTLHTVGNLYIVSLSVADLIVGVTVMPLSLVYLLEAEWRLGQIVCRFWLVMDYVASTASIFSLFILCLDRYRSVQQPLRYLQYRTRGRAIIMILGAWLLSVTWVVPILGWRLFFEVERKPEAESKCDTDFRFVTWFKVVTAILNFYIPSILMLWFYTQIYRAVKNHYRQRECINKLHSSFEKNDLGQNGDGVGRGHACGGNRNDRSTLPHYSNADELLDHYSLQQSCCSKEAEGRSGETWAEKQKMRNMCCCQAVLFTVPKQIGGSGKESDKCAPCSPCLEEEPEVPLKLPSLPLGLLQVESENVQKMFTTMDECNLSVSSSALGVCEVPPHAEMRRYAAIVCNSDFLPPVPAPWPPGADPQFDSANAPTLRQSWQKFCAQSRQCIQSLQVYKERKAAKQLGFIIAAFLVCWIPYFVIFMVMAFCKTCIHDDLHMFAIWLGYLNSTLNPFIYPLCNENFKRVFKSILHIH